MLLLLLLPPMERTFVCIHRIQTSQCVEVSRLMDRVRFTWSIARKIHRCYWPMSSWSFFHIKCQMTCALCNSSYCKIMESRISRFNIILQLFQQEHFNQKWFLFTHCKCSYNTSIAISKHNWFKLPSFCSHQMFCCVVVASKYRLLENCAARVINNK